MQCALYDAGRCRSCAWIEKSLPQQCQAKMNDLRQLLGELPVEQWCEPVSGAESAFRNKAKMVVSGSVEKPLLGMLHRDGSTEDLTDCPLYSDAFRRVFTVLKPFIARAGLTPYNVARKRGELKYLLITESTLDGGMMLRFVLRSETKLAQLEAALPWLLAQLPQLKVVSANIQPVHMAIMEGEREIVFTAERALEENFNGVPLWIRPQSFFQTNPQVASQLYATARDWVRALPVKHMWDLFCGVGGFGLHCATPAMRLTGIEIADLVVVNPPRRGIGEELCEFLSAMAPKTILYSSCNAQTMAKDIRLLEGYRIEKIQLFDMFPHTAHYEVLTLLQRG